MINGVGGAYLSSYCQGHRHLKSRLPFERPFQVSLYEMDRRAQWPQSQPPSPSSSSSSFSSFSSFSSLLIAIHYATPTTETRAKDMFSALRPRNQWPMVLRVVGGRPFVPCVPFDPFVARANLSFAVRG
jgi:hypothetical protein